MKNGAADSPPPIESLGEWKRSGNDWSAVVNLEINDIESTVVSIGGEVVDVRGVSLNDWFLSASRA